MADDRLTPTLKSCLERMHDARQAGLHVSLPGRVESYDASRQSCSVQPLLMRGTEAGGDRVAEKIAVINDVPVVFPGAGGYRMTFPVAVGDTVLLVFMETSIDEWLQVGGLIDPRDDRRHDVNDAVAVVGLRDFAHALGDAPTDCMSVGFDGGPVIEIDEDVVAVGGRDDAQPTLKADDFMNHLHTLVSAIATHAGITGVSPDPTLVTACTTFNATNDKTSIARVK